MTETQDFSINRGADYVLRFRLVQPPDTELGNTASWTTVFELRTARGANTVLSANGTISDISRASEFGIFDVDLTANQTAGLTASTYFFAFRRTDAGYVDVLAKGQMRVESY